MKCAVGLLLLMWNLAAGADQGWSIRRVANMPDGAPAFEVVSPQGQVTTRIDCINNGWYDADGLAVRLLRSTEVMAAVQAKGGRLEIDDLGPAKFDCVSSHPKPEVTRKPEPRVVPTGLQRGSQQAKRRHEQTARSPWSAALQAFGPVAHQQVNGDPLDV